MTAKEESIVTAIWGQAYRSKSTKFCILKQVMKANKDRLFLISETGQGLKVKNY
ncbi:MAG: hypothetical protein PHV03_05565 [Desulfitobacteriaceae bacterium]|nr:hypothetical protein [Desulfitobacteriaceae bacterium]